MPNNFISSKKYTPFNKTGDGKSYTPKSGQSTSSAELKNWKQMGKKSK